MDPSSEKIEGKSTIYNIEGISVIITYIIILPSPTFHYIKTKAN